MVTSVPPRWANWLVVALLAVFAARVIYHSTRISPTYDEPAHLVAGYTYLRWHDYRLNPEHPPLVKKLVAAPLLLFDPLPDAINLDDPRVQPGPGSISWQRVKELWQRSASAWKGQWYVTHEVLYGVRDETMRRHGVTATMQIDPSARIGTEEFLNDVDRLVFWGRLPLLVFGLLLCQMVYSWSRDLFGWTGGLLALSLAAFDPNLIAHSTLITSDAASAALLFGSVYGLWRFYRWGRWQDGTLAAACTAFAFVTKFSAILLAPTLLLLTLVAGWRLAASGNRRRALRLLLLLVGCGLAAYVALWAAYDFRYAGMVGKGTGIRMPVEATLRQAAEREGLFEPGLAGREYLGFSDRVVTWVNHHRLLPEAYLYGLAYARLASRARPAFLRGKYSLRGFRSFFFWTFLLKTPLVSLIAIGAAMALVVGRTRWMSNVFLLLPVALFFGAAVGSHLNIGHRHILAIYPFLFVLCGGLSPLLLRLCRAREPIVLGGALMLVAASSSVVFWPPWEPKVMIGRPLEYFNELAAGPQNGFRLLVDSNLDWGQGLKELARWLADRSIEEPINLCYFGTADPRFYQIRHARMPCEYMFAPQVASADPLHAMAAPGYLAISLTHLQGERDSEGLRQARRAALQRAEFVDSIGYSMFVLRLPEP